MYRTDYITDKRTVEMDYKSRYNKKKKRPYMGLDIIIIVFSTYY